MYVASEQVLFREKFIDWGGAIPISMQQVPVGINVARILFKLLLLYYWSYCK